MSINFDHWRSGQWRADVETAEEIASIKSGWSRPPQEEPFFHVGERAYPGGLMVNGLGQRFVNESAPYIDVVHAMYAAHRADAPHIPAYFIFDQRYHHKYLFGVFLPRLPIPRRSRASINSPLTVMILISSVASAPMTTTMAIPP